MPIPLIAGAAALSALGMGMQAASTPPPGRANRRERDMFYQTGGRPNMEQLQSLYGQDSDLAAARQMLGPEWRQSQNLDQILQQIAPGRNRADFERFITQNPGYNQQQNALIEGLTARQGADLGYFDTQANQLQNQIGQNTGNLRNAFDTISGRIGQAYGQSTGAATGVYRNYGRDMERSIREDLSLANRSAESRAAAASARRGGGNTNDQMVLGGLQSLNRQSANRNIADVRQRGAELTGGAIERGMGARNSALSNLWGNQLGMEQNRAAAMEGFGSNRLSARMALENQYAQNDYNNRSGLNTTNLNQLNNIANANRMDAIPFPQQGNQGLAGVGGNLAGVGGMLLGDWYEQTRNQNNNIGAVQGPRNPAYG